MCLYNIFYNNYKFGFSGRGERYHDISGNNVEHATYMIDADTNSLDMVDSDTSLYFEDAMQHDAPSAGGFYKVFNLNIYICKIKYIDILCYEFLGLPWGNKNWWFVVTLFYAIST